MSARQFAKSDFLDAALTPPPPLARPSAVARRPAATPLGDQEFVGMLRDLHPHGGLVRGVQVQALLDIRRGRPSEGSDARTIDRWLDNRQAFAFGWSEQVWLPTFQLDGLRSMPYPAVARVLRVLDDTFDDREILLWLITPNSWLDDQAPAALLSRNAQDLIHAARADRYVARG